MLVFPKNAEKNASTIEKGLFGTSTKLLLHVTMVAKFLGANKLKTSVQNIKLLKTLLCHTWRRPVAIKV